LREGHFGPFRKEYLKKVGARKSIRIRIAVEGVLLVIGGKRLIWSAVYPDEMNSGRRMVAPVVVSGGAVNDLWRPIETVALSHIPIEPAADEPVASGAKHPARLRSVRNVKSPGLATKKGRQ
jgi:hypothetical protein